MRMVLVLLPSKVQRKPRRCRGCFVPFFRKKVPKNSPADASAYFVPANVRNGRLFAGLQANRPRFLPLLAGPSFHGYGIGPESFAAFRGGKDASGTSRKHRSLRSPLEAVLNRRILACSGERTTAVFARGVLCTFWPQKVPKTPRQMPAPTSSRLTLAPGDYSRGRTCPVPFARAFSRAFVSRLRHRAGIVRGNSVFSAG